MTRPALTIRAIPVPREGAERAFHAALDILAEALAQQIIADARAEVADRLGVNADAIDREHGGLQDELSVQADPTRRGPR